MEKIEFMDEGAILKELGDFNQLLSNKAPSAGVLICDGHRPSTGILPKADTRLFFEALIIGLEDILNCEDVEIVRAVTSDYGYQLDIVVIYDQDEEDQSASFEQFTISLTSLY